MTRQDGTMRCPSICTMDLGERKKRRRREGVVKAALPLWDFVHGRNRVEFRKEKTVRRYLRSGRDQFPTGGDAHNETAQSKQVGGSLTRNFETGSRRFFAYARLGRSCQDRSTVSAGCWRWSSSNKCPSVADDSTAWTRAGRTKFLMLFSGEL